MGSEASTVRLNLTSIALSPRSTVEFEPSISFPLNCIVSSVEGNEPNSTCTFKPFAPGTKLSASCRVERFISKVDESRVMTPSLDTR